MAIYTSICHRNSSTIRSILSQVETLVNLKYLDRTICSSIDSVKYKCLLNFKQIMIIAKSIKFEIIRYLYDFNNL
ncbi:PREDICTED: origin recognition complex subunit 5-like [Amphimedon queenslandica]|nr:PREDICTED: origin recognition complex subunit 5-like [Amphimedon queenslandica]|eukprot:XP_019853927.1 PREDICTED: origin recognition complex subunit 5-like [Amphimedon queenslandica]